MQIRASRLRTNPSFPSVEKTRPIHGIILWLETTTRCIFGQTLSDILYLLIWTTGIAVLLQLIIQVRK